MAFDTGYHIETSFSSPGLAKSWEFRPCIRPSQCKMRRFHRWVLIYHRKLRCRISQCRLHYSFEPTSLQCRRSTLIRSDIYHLLMGVVVTGNGSRRIHAAKWPPFPFLQWISEVYRHPRPPWVFRSQLFSHLRLAEQPAGGRVKILLHALKQGIFGRSWQQRHLLLIFGEGDGSERGGCFDQQPFHPIKCCGPVKVIKLIEFHVW